MISKRFTSTVTISLVLSALGLANFVVSASASTGNNYNHSPPINSNADIPSSSSSPSSYSLSDDESNSLDGINGIPPPPKPPISIPIPVPPSTSSPKPAEKTPSIVKLDLAGEIKTHISSPTYVGPNGIHMEARTDMDTAPLFQWGTIRTRDGSVDEMSGGVGMGAGAGAGASNFLKRLNMPIPTVHVGAKYNFKTAWYGATRLIGNLSWGHSLKSSSASNGSGSGSGNKHILTNIRGELGLQNPDDYSVEVGFAMPRNHENMNISNNIRSTRSKLSLRYDTRSTMATVSASTSIHRRLGLVGKATILLGDVLRPAAPKLGSNVISANDNDDEKRSLKLESIPKEASASFFQHKIPQEELNLMEGSWLPEVKMTAGGQARAGSSIGLKDWDLRKIRNHQASSGGSNSMNKVGVRLMVSRQLNWNIVGMFNGSAEDAEYDNDTTVKLEVGGLGEYGYTSVSAEAAAERIGETFRCTLLQEQIFKCTN